MTTSKRTIGPVLGKHELASGPAPAIRMGRIMNSQMNVSLPLDMHERLRELAWEHRMPLSHVVRELLGLGLRTHPDYGTEAAEEPAGQ